MLSANTGLVTGWISPAVVEFAQPESIFFDVDANQMAWLASMMPLGALFGATFSAAISERFGRMPSIVFWSFSFMVINIFIKIILTTSYLIFFPFTKP